MRVRIDDDLLQWAGGDEGKAVGQPEAVLRRGGATTHTAAPVAVAEDMCLAQRGARRARSGRAWRARAEGGERQGMTPEEQRKKKQTTTKARSLLRGGCAALTEPTQPADPPGSRGHGEGQDRRVQWVRGQAGGEWHGGGGRQSSGESVWLVVVGLTGRIEEAFVRSISRDVESRDATVAFSPPEAESAKQEAKPMRSRQRTAGPAKRWMMGKDRNAVNFASICRDKHVQPGFVVFSGGGARPLIHVKGRRMVATLAQSSPWWKKEKRRAALCMQACSCLRPILYLLSSADFSFSATLPMSTAGPAMPWWTGQSATQFHWLSAQCTAFTVGCKKKVLAPGRVSDFVAS